MPQKILAIAAHPDDETLGCGGTLLKHAARGDELNWIIGTSTYQPRWSEEVIKAKDNEINEVANVYGMKEVFRFGYKATQLGEQIFGDLMHNIRSPNICSTQY